MAETSTSTREKILGWLAEQGVSTVLLFTMCVGLWYGIPWARTCMKEDMAQIQEVHREQMTRIMETHDKQLESVVGAFNEDQRRDESADKSDRELIMKLLSERPADKRQLAERP